MTETYNIDPDPETVLVAVDECEVVYQKTDSGADVVGLLIDDNGALGHFFIAMTPEQATDIARNLAGVVDHIAQVRSAWEKDHPTE